MNKRLVRVPKGSMLGGVCTGLGRYFTIDPTIVRILFVFLSIGAGGGVLAYLILWVVLPREDLADQPEMKSFEVNEFGERARQVGEEFRQATSQPNPKVWSFLGVGLVLVGFIYLLRVFNIPWLSWLSTDIFWPAALIVLGGILLWRAVRKE